MNKIFSFFRATALGRFLVPSGIILIVFGFILVAALNENGVNAAVIGFLKDGNDRVIVNGDEKRFLELPQADEIHRILL